MKLWPGQDVNRWKDEKGDSYIPPTLFAGGKSETLELGFPN